MAHLSFTHFNSVTGIHTRPVVCNNLKMKRTTLKFKQSSLVTNFEKLSFKACGMRDHFRSNIHLQFIGPVTQDMCPGMNLLGIIHFIQWNSPFFLYNSSMNGNADIHVLATEVQY